MVPQDHLLVHILATLYTIVYKLSHRGGGGQWQNLSNRFKAPSYDHKQEITHNVHTIDPSKTEHNALQFPLPCEMIEALMSHVA